MSTFLIKAPKTITRQAGDDCDVQFTVPDALPLGSVTDIHFLVTGNAVSKPVILDLTAPDVTVTGQQITVPIEGDDTTGLQGDYNWSLRLKYSGQDIAIGKGPFKLV